LCIKQKENFGLAIDKLEQRFGRNIIRMGFTNEFIPVKQGFMTSSNLIY